MCNIKHFTFFKTLFCLYVTCGRERLPWQCDCWSTLIRIVMCLTLRHQDVHTENRPLTCVCNKSFKLKKHLKDRILLCCAKQVIHTEVRRFTCHVFNMSFSCRNNYQNIIGNLLSICDVCSVAGGTSNVQKSSTQL